MGVMERVATRRKKAIAPGEIEAAKIATDCLLRGDCIAEMAKLPDACIDMIFADPPYNLQLAATSIAQTAAMSTPSPTPGTSSTASPPTTPLRNSGWRRRGAC